MLHETETFVRPIEETTSAKTFKQNTKEFLAAKTVKLVLERARPKIFDPIEKSMEYAEGFSDIFCREIADKNTIPVLISSHEGHADLISIAIVSKQLTELVNTIRKPEEKFKGFLLPIASSLETGHQGVLLQEFTNQMNKNYLPKHFLSTAPYTRKKDIEKYGLPPSSNIAFTRKMFTNIENGDGIALFPEASVESGRLKKQGGNEDDINGLQRFDCISLDSIMEKMNRHNKKGLFIPIGSYGAFRIINSDIDIQTGKPINILTKETYKALGSINPKPLMSVKVGLPIRGEDLLNELKRQEKEITLENIGDFFGEKVAELLPLNARGHYSASPRSIFFLGGS